ncbi:hypothetical protein [Spirosoma sp.]
MNEFIDDFPSVKYEQDLAVLDLAVSTVTLNFAARA